VESSTGNKVWDISQTTSFHIHGRNPRPNGKILLTTDHVFVNPVFLINFRQGNVKLVLLKEFKPIILHFASEN
jgi:hypothetical protein